ncbi:MAG: prepilin peptidase, partial [Kiritimatiellae bacterium]|nr:prepilin peptidase [Kiritimatiellia bacterium]
MAKELMVLFGFFSFSLGACVASFLNVVIWRVPRGESIVSPPSHCPKCGSSIRWWQNVPIISWLVLRGKCANCKTPISPRYIIVEFIGAVLFLAVFLRILAPFLHIIAADASFLWPKIVILLVLWVWVALMIVGSFIDFDHKLLPDFVTVGGMILGVVNGAISSAISGRLFPILVSVSGLAFGFGLLWLVRF